jgi:CO dehydrogenase/acetyl-CoA synthase beta subunit
MLISRHQNQRQNVNIRIANRFFETVAQFKHLGATVTDQNLIQEEIKIIWNLGNACFYSIQNRLCFRLLSKNLKIRIQKTTAVPVVLYGCKTWSLTLREGCLRTGC